MMTRLARWFVALPTAAKLLLILSAALLPIGLGLVWVAHTGIREADAALKARSNEQARAAARAIESLIARNALALRIAANGAGRRSGGLRDRPRRDRGRAVRGIGRRRDAARSTAAHR